MDKLILGIDAGNYMPKIVGAYGTDKFRSNICNWFERDIEERFGDDDMEFEINGRKGFAGTIAMYEDEFGNGSMYGDSKAHEDTKVRVLLAIYRYLNKYCPYVIRINIVVGQPIKRHNDTEKDIIKKMLMGQHTITVNGDKRTFFIENVGVAAEGSTAFWSNPMNGTVRIIDVGSGTVNAATIIDNRHVNTSSDTFNFGVETVNNKDDYENLARGIIRNTTKLKWNKADKVLICGGVAELVEPFIKVHYKNCEVMKPNYKANGVTKVLSPVFANALGFYNVGLRAFM